MKKLLIGILIIAAGVAVTVSVNIYHKTNEDVKLNKAAMQEMKENKASAEKIKKTMEKDSKKSLKLDFSDL